MKALKVMTWKVEHGCESRLKVKKHGRTKVNEKREREWTNEHGSK
jgi:hypothetical protein